MENEVKEPAPKYHFISPDEYLAMERASQEKHEYYDGYVQAMSGARLKHIQIGSNLNIVIGSFLSSKECQYLPLDMRVSTPGRNSYMYPDASIICGEPVMEDDQFDTLTNPSVIFEIWSPSTQRKDVGYKLVFYQQIPSLQEYIMIDSVRRYVQTVRKQSDGAWRFEEINNSEGKLHIEAIKFTLTFDDIYQRTGLL